MSIATSFLQPTWMTVPDWDYTLGPEVGELCAAVGFAPDGPQQLILDATFAIKDGMPAAFEVVIVGPRQNIKTGALKQIDLGLTFLLQRPLVVWSAHEVSTSTQSFRDLADLVETHDFLSRQVKRLYRPEGRERIELVGGGEVRFKARTRSGGRGLTGDETILDEAFALKSSHLGALLPIMLTKPHGQVIYASSAGLPDSAVLRSLRDRGRRGDARLAYFEYGDTRPNEGCLLVDCDHVVTREGCALDDRARWWEILPALGTRVTEESVADLRRSMPPEEFAREVMGWWDDPADAGSEISLASWLALGSELSRPGDPVVLGVDTAPNHSWSSIVACGAGAAGRPVLEVVDRRAGSAWVADRLAQLQASHEVSGVAIDETGPVGALRPALDAAGVTYTALTGRESAQACDSIVADIALAALEHRNEEPLTAAIVGARRRRSGDMARWSRVDSTVDITPLVAATVALYLHRNGGSTISPTVHFI